MGAIGYSSLFNFRFPLRVSLRAGLKTRSTSRLSALSMPMRACSSGPRPSAAINSASVAGLPILEVLLGLRQFQDVGGGVLERNDLATAGKRNRILECAGPWHQTERGTNTAPLPANVRASCSAIFFVGIPDIERRLALSSKGNCRTIDPSSDWTSKGALCSNIFMPAIEARSAHTGKAIT
jgi:hypothetical protein